MVFIGGVLIVVAALVVVFIAFAAMGFLIELTGKIFSYLNTRVCSEGVAILSIIVIATIVLYFIGITAIMSFLGGMIPLVLVTSFFVAIYQILDDIFSDDDDDD